MMNDLTGNEFEIFIQESDRALKIKIAVCFIIAVLGFIVPWAYGWIKLLERFGWI